MVKSSISMSLAPTTFPEKLKHIFYVLQISGLLILVIEPQDSTFYSNSSSFYKDSFVPRNYCSKFFFY